MRPVPGGYVHETEAAYELVDDAIASVREDLRRDGVELDADEFEARCPSWTLTPTGLRTM
jgi:hypothetical protein